MCGLPRPPPPPPVLTHHHGHQLQRNGESELGLSLVEECMRLSFCPKLLTWVSVMILFMVICPDFGPWVGFVSHLMPSECTLLSNLTQVSHAGWAEQSCVLHAVTSSLGPFESYFPVVVVAHPRGKRFLTYPCEAWWCFKGCSWILKAMCIFCLFFTFGGFVLKC